jgi:hypothetical protein
MSTTLVELNRMKHVAAAQFLPNLAVFSFALAWALSPSSAQQITGSITGSVKDGQHALVTTATIKATNVDTGLSRSTRAGCDGIYLISP